MILFGSEVFLDQMVGLICTKLLRAKRKASPFSHGYWFSISFLRPMSGMSNFKDPQTFTVSYLQKSCGLSLQSAILASKKVSIETTHNPDSVLNLMRSHGLTRAQISKVVTIRPALLLVDSESKVKPNMELFRSLGFTGATLAQMLMKDPRVLETDSHAVVEFFKAHGFSSKQIATLSMKRPTLYLFNANKTFKQKLEFFKSLGLTELEISKCLSSEPYILERSLENQIIPCIQVLRRVLSTDEDVLRVIRTCYRILEYNLEKVLEPNILVLMSHGVPKSLITKMFVYQPRSLLLSTDRLSKIMIEVSKLGFDPNRLMFILAVKSMAMMTKALWEEKVEVYQSFGLSKDEIYSAFRLQPMCMQTSKKKIKKLMGFYVDKLNLKPSVICRHPHILLLSLEKRIIPRCSVLQLLLSRGLVKDDVNIIYVLRMTEKRFMQSIVKKYQEVLPAVVEAHKGKIEFQGFPILLKM